MCMYSLKCNDLRQSDLGEKRPRGGGTPENLNGVTYKLEKKVKDDPETWEEVTKNEQTGMKILER